ncbi:uncharacterized protein NPIL_422381 [Nephila pilipes]|uniref:Nucleolar and spindle-associated protein 1 n=1 Tax=Nephila pilipes TaxID=299642 RepID=A0A8X6QGT1_NEPPI|nr:uncharacterized protein NPIL_422381 [Nephila pilipes]
MDTPNEESLRQMPFSELKKHAKRKGIKGNMKAENIIALILEDARSAEDSFVTMEQQIINSCKKHKARKFEEDKQIASDTPRRETYTLDSPSDTIVALNDLIVSSASPVLKKTPTVNETSQNVTMSRGSERKSKKRKVSFVTPLRKSARLSAMTPHYASVKDRPKTPIPSRNSTGRKNSSSIRTKISFVETPIEECESNILKKLSGRKEKRVSTPMPLSKTKRMNLSSTGLAAPIATPEVSFVDEHPKEISASKLIAKSEFKEMTAIGPLPSTKGKIIFTPKSDIKKAATPLSMSGKKNFTPKSGAKIVSSPYKTSGTKVKATPNFKKIHQKAFEKMESIDEYQQRKATNSARKIKQHLQSHDQSSASKKSNVKKTAASKPFGGIPFIPSKTNSSSFQIQPVCGKKSATTKAVSRTENTLTKKFINRDSKKSVKHVSQENTPLKRRIKFDLKASLSKKLPYKPHAGPLKPLTENLNTSLACPPSSQKTKTGNKIVEAKRVESRGILRGVRKNRRFELQMSNRKLTLC